MAKFFMGFSRDEIIDRLTAQDVYTVLRAADEGDFSFIRNIISGVNFVQYHRMTDDDLKGEYHDRAEVIDQLISDDHMPWDVTSS